MNGLKLAARQLVRYPGFSAVVIATLALGIGGRAVDNISEPNFSDAIPALRAARVDPATALRSE